MARSEHCSRACWTRSLNIRRWRNRNGDRISSLILLIRRYEFSHFLSRCCFPRDSLGGTCPLPTEKCQRLAEASPFDSQFQLNTTPSEYETRGPTLLRFCTPKEIQARRWWMGVSLIVTWISCRSRISLARARIRKYRTEIETCSAGLFHRYLSLSCFGTIDADNLAVNSLLASPISSFDLIIFHTERRNARYTWPTPLYTRLVVEGVRRDSDALRCEYVMHLASS